MSGPADKPASKRFGVPNILTSSEKAKRKQDADAGRSNTHLHDYVVGNLLRRRQWVDHRDRNVERAEEQSRRYTVPSDGGPAGLPDVDLGGGSSGSSAPDQA